MFEDYCNVWHAIMTKSRGLSVNGLPIRSPNVQCNDTWINISSDQSRHCFRIDFSIVAPQPRPARAEEGAQLPAAPPGLCDVTYRRLLGETIPTADQVEEVQYILTIQSFVFISP